MRINKFVAMVIIFIGLLAGGLVWSHQPPQVEAAPPAQQPTTEPDADEQTDDDADEEEDDDEVDDDDAGDDAAAAEDETGVTAIESDLADLTASRDEGQVCSATVQAQFRACQNEVRDDFFVATAVCLNLTDDEDRAACLAEAGEARQEEAQLCLEQRQARLDLCQTLGQEPYAPSFDPAEFDSDFTNLSNPNPYYPLAIGNVREYVGGDETVRVEVLDQTKLIEGVTCIVINDVVSVEGQVVEDTDDWIAQGLDGTVDYCGESVRDYETFAGDNPAEAELIETAGSFKVGRDGAQPGTLFMAAPVVGQTYRQEWSPNNAEDAATVVSTSYSFGADPDLDQFVPQDLVDLLCADGDCIVTADFTPIEPDVLEYKYYAPGIGVFLEIKPDDGEVLQLVACNYDSRCDELPQP
ncbi:MAG: hypothetical protein KDI79_29985 [Anaerolineae bacterium]|nr:hypothetical protein [Anaerolineae bacterium]